MKTFKGQRQRRIFHHLGDKAKFTVTLKTRIVKITFVDKNSPVYRFLKKIFR